MARKKKGRRGNNEGSITQRPDGRWEARVRVGFDSEGKPIRKSFYGKTREEAAAKMNDALGKVLNGTWVEPSKVLLKDWLESWLEGRKPRLAENTYLKHDNMIQHHLIPTLGTVKMSKLTTRQIQSMLNEKLKNGRVDGKGGLAPETVHQIHRTLNAALNQAIKEKMITDNPALHCELPELEASEMRVFNEDELVRFFQAAEDNYYFPAFYLDLVTGLRRGELLGLRWADTDLERGTIYVWQQVVKTSGTPRIQLKGKTKTKSSTRTIRIDESTIEVLRQHLAAQTEKKVELLANGLEYFDHGLMFCMPDGRPVDPDNFYRRFKSVLKKADIPPARLHDVRHSYATLSLEAGASLKAVQRALGHKTIKMTGDRYCHVTDRMEEEAASKIGGIISNWRQMVVKSEKDEEEKKNRTL